MSAGLAILERQVESVRSLIAFTAKVEALRQERDEAEAEGDIAKTMSIFGELVAIIGAGPGSQALAVA